MSDQELEGLAMAIANMTPPERLRLAADLLDRKRPDVAHGIIRRVADELGAVLLDLRLKRER